MCTHSDSFGSNAQENIDKFLNSLENYVNSSKSLVTLVYAIAEHVPYFNNEKYSTFWKEEVSVLIW